MRKISYRPMVSVIIPSYNRENTIRDSILSVLGQTYDNVEVIVVDDCSSDGTSEVVSAIDDKRLRYIRLPKNLGACAARNKGVQEAKGELVAFQDSDDYWQENKIERQLKSLIKSGADITFCAIKVYGSGGKLMRRVPRCCYHSRRITFQDMLENCIVSTQTIIGKRKCFLATRFDPKMPRFQDWDLMLRMAKHGNAIWFSNEALVRLNRHDESISSNIASGRVGLRRIYEKHKSDFEDNKKALANYYMIFGTIVDDLTEKMDFYKKAVVTYSSPMNRIRSIVRLWRARNVQK